MVDTFFFGRRRSSAMIVKIRVVVLQRAKNKQTNKRKNLLFARRESRCGSDYDFKRLLYQRQRLRRKARRSATTRRNTPHSFLELAIDDDDDDDDDDDCLINK